MARPNISSLTGRLKRTLTIVLGGSDSIAESKAVYQWGVKRQDIDTSVRVLWVDGGVENKGWTRSLCVLLATWPLP